MQFTTEYFSALVEDAIRNIAYPTITPNLFKPIQYALEEGGKRLRPSLVLAVYSALSGQNARDAINQALSVEMFHNFTLLHDDVMDNADVRRGRPAVHKAWNANTAILSGDAMLTMSSQLLAMCPAGKLALLNEIFNKTAMGVYEGQQLDMEFETRKDVTVNEYLQMISLKTSVLLAGACEIGAVMAGADVLTREYLYDYGLNLGIAFQLRDDWLDTYGDPEIFGKEIGGDIINEKKTWLLINALEKSNGELDLILSENIDQKEKIERVRNLYNRLGLGEGCNELAAKYRRKAIESVCHVEMPDNAREFFVKLAVNADTRNK